MLRDLYGTVSVRRSVGPSVGPSVRRSVRPAIDFLAFASGFCITAPAQSHETDVVVYTGPPAAPAPHITAPAQPHMTMPVRVSRLVSLKFLNNSYFMVEMIKLGLVLDTKSIFFIFHLWEITRVQKNSLKKNLFPAFISEWKGFEQD